MKILITGATGLVGRAITDKLLQAGEDVSILSRSRCTNINTKVYLWDYKKKYIEPGALDDVEAIIHLAGADVSKRWTESYKKEIYHSRIDTTELLYTKCKELNQFPKTFICASGASYYGQVTQKKPFTEDSPPGKDFISYVACNWEKAADSFIKHNSRVVKIRTGLVISANGGAVAKMYPAAKNNILSPLGSGNQFYPWIHIKDLVNIYVAALYHATATGSYNAAAPAITTNTAFTKAFMKSLNKTILLPHVPTFILKLMLGEMSCLLLKGSPLDPKKTENQLHEYQYKYIDKCFESL